jgi:ribosomal RNA methyltransferase Nop2
MQKQGPPQSLDEILGAKKRKSAAPTNGAIKKQKTADKDAPKKKPAAQSNGAKKVRGEREQVPAVKPKATKGLKKATKPAALDVLADSDEEDLDLDDDEIDIEEDGLNGLDMDSDADDFDLAPSGSDDEILDDSDAEVRREKMWSEDEDSDAEERLTAANIEGLSRKLNEQRAREAAEAEAELAEDALQTNIAAELPDDEDETNGGLLAPDLQLLRSRITETVRVLSSFKDLADPAKSRADYTQSLLKDVCAYYGYSPFLAEKLYSLFPPQEALAFFDANETPRPMVIRTNTLRTLSSTAV